MSALGDWSKGIWIRLSHLDRRATLSAFAALTMIVALAGVALASKSDSQDAASKRAKSSLAAGNKGRTPTSESLDSTPASSETSSPGQTTTAPGANDSTAIGGSSGGGGSDAPDPVVATSPSGMTVSLRPAVKAAVTGKPVSFASIVKDPAGGLKALSWDFGDGSRSNANTGSCNDASNRATVVNGSTNFPANTSHLYRDPGTYTVRVTAATGAKCGANANDETLVATTQIKVDGPALGSNGPSAPTVTAKLTDAAMPEDPHIALAVASGDTDGFVSQTVVDWDDGTTPTVITYPLSSCVDPKTAWPSSSHSQSPDHTYSTPGIYDVTVTVTSTGCDGTAAQQSVAVVRGIVTGGTVSIPQPS